VAISKSRLVSLERQAREIASDSGSLEDKLESARKAVESLCGLSEGQLKQLAFDESTPSLQRQGALRRLLPDHAATTELRAIYQARVDAHRTSAEMAQSRQDREQCKRMAAGMHRVLMTIIEPPNRQLR